MNIGVWQLMYTYAPDRTYDRIEFVDIDVLLRWKTGQKQKQKK